MQFYDLLLLVGGRRGLATHETNSNVQYLHHIEYGIGPRQQFTPGETTLYVCNVCNHSSLTALPQN